MHPNREGGLPRVSCTRMDLRDAVHANFAAPFPFLLR
jgi:hypothetical protein